MAWRTPGTGRTMRLTAVLTTRERRRGTDLPTPSRTNSPPDR
ncbi:hypothetical protein ACFOY4_34930 [Actinomadura syzygii]|nr:hypothetical protein [Actinomadura syzygii]